MKPQVHYIPLCVYFEFLKIFIVECMRKIIATDHSYYDLLLYFICFISISEQQGQTCW